ncbi:MAG: hypothetical protein L6R28_02230 [Planctomycetes bacterium]|nr:hypothetical protein [Planctomycetota bacterium]
MLDKRSWERLTKTPLPLDAMPHWLRDVLQKPFEEVETLPAEPPPGTVRRPSVEFSKITASYLSFLKTQIELNARGDAWTAILQTRLVALQEVVGQKTLCFSISRGEDSAYIRIHATENRLIHWEVC